MTKNESTMDETVREVAVILDGDDRHSDDVRAGLALRLAEHHGAHIQVFQLNQGALGIDPELEEASADEFAGVRFRGMRETPKGDRWRFRTAVPRLSHITANTGRWADEFSDEELYERLQTVDLVIAGSPLALDRDWSRRLDEVVERSGRPILVVPRAFCQRRSEERTFGGRALVCWNASAPSSRAVHAALPFLRRASEVVVLMATDTDGQRRAAHLVDQLTAHLALHQIASHGEVLPIGELSPPEAVLARISELDSDLLVMGAYGHSRLQERLLGGMSRSLLHTVPIPILTSH